MMIIVCFFVFVFFLTLPLVIKVGIFQWLSDKESVCNAGDTGSILGSGRSP